MHCLTREGIGLLGNEGENPAEVDLLVDGSLHLGDHAGLAEDELLLLLNVLVNAIEKQLSSGLTVLTHHVSVVGLILDALGASAGNLELVGL